MVIRGPKRAVGWPAERPKERTMPDERGFRLVEPGIRPSPGSIEGHGLVTGDARGGDRGDRGARRRRRRRVPPGSSCRLRCRAIACASGSPGGAATVWSRRPSRGSRRRRAPMPPCPHFGTCGGCQLQHVPAAQYRAWKREQVAAALAQHGLRGIRVEPLESTPPGGRRRARFAFERRGAALRLGFRERSGHRVIALSACPVLVPELVALLAPLARAARPPRPGAPSAASSRSPLSATGIDLLIVAARPARPGDREALAAFADGPRPGAHLLVPACRRRSRSRSCNAARRA